MGTVLLDAAERQHPVAAEAMAAATSGLVSWPMERATGHSFRAGFDHGIAEPLAAEHPRRFLGCLVAETLLGLLGVPGHVRRDDEPVGDGGEAAEVGRLGGEYVQRRDRGAARRHALDQRLLVDELAARGVDQD